MASFLLSLQRAMAAELLAVVGGLALITNLSSKDAIFELE